TVDGRDTRTSPPRELADVVGVVTQDPLAGCVTDTVEEELAYGMEQLAIEPGVMRKRVEETLDLLGLADLRRRGARRDHAARARPRRHRRNGGTPPRTRRAVRRHGAAPARRRNGRH